MLSNVLPETEARGEQEAQRLLKRTPHSYLYNQAYGLWFFISWFILTLIITHNVTTTQYGIFTVGLTAFNTILYVIAFGLEDAITTYIPRIFSEYGRASAAQLTRRLLALRLATLVPCLIIMIFGLPVIAALIQLLPIPGAAQTAAGLHSPEVLANTIPIAVYVLGSAIGNLLNAVYAALMRMRFVFYVGSAIQALVLALGFVVLKLGWGVNGVFWMLALTSLLVTAAFALWLAPFIFTRGAEYRQPLKPVIQLGLSAWLANLATGALLKQISFILLGVFAISLTGIGYFNLAFQLADSANFLLVAGFGGVGGAALAAAFVGHNHERLARSWQALIKVETLLAAPGLVFSLFNAQIITHVLYGSNYDPVGPLLAIFLFFNLLVRIIGTTIHQSTLYVMGKPRLVVLSQWPAILCLIATGVVLIPLFGPAGALLSDGIAKTLTGVLMLIFVLRDLPRHYPKELLIFTSRFLLALFLAALPGILILLWHPANRLLQAAVLGVSGVVFLLLCFWLLTWLKPLSTADVAMIEGVNPKIARYLHWFVRG
ncbi:MAG TPA: polysaccharide biosynthesis C-terminal domain-containing protein [Ktedonobacteraceae bacterium]|nr:polysaccharide biosynthesis C-terminal domain-containing protein [Ktedonobacteraceae bacterium]